MKKITLFFTLLIAMTFSWQSNAQLEADNTCSNVFDDISTTGTEITLSDDGESNIIIPFDFTLDGVTSSDLRVGNNGGVLFGVTTGEVSLSSTPTEIGFYPFADDLNAGGSVLWETLGTAPNRRVVVMWNDRQHYSTSPSGATFELILHETTNEITFLYQDVDFGNIEFDDAISAGILVIGANGTYTYSTDTALAGVTCINWTVPTCLPAADLVVSNNMLTSVDLAWTDNNSLTVTDYEYVVQEAGTGVPTGSGTATTANPQPLTGLNASTVYEVYMRAICSGADSSYWAMTQFTTLCAPLGDFTENFDVTPTQEVPLCWSSIVNASNIYAAVEVVSNNENSAPNSLRLYNSGDDSEALELFLITPQLTDLPNDTHRVRFMATGGDGYGLMVGTITDPTDSATFTPIQGLDVVAGYNEYIVDFATSTSDEYVAIKYVVNTTYDTIYIDDFVWEELPTCIKPSDIAVSGITGTDVTLAWTDVNGATEWEYVVQEAGTGEPVGAGTSITTNPFTDESLMASTTYEVYVRSKCSAMDFSAWAGPVEFVSECDAFGDFNENFDLTTAGEVTLCWSAIVNATSTSAGVQVVSFGANSAPNAMRLYNADDISETLELILISPQLTDLPNDTHRARFMASGGEGYALLAGTMTDPTDSSTFTPIAGVDIPSGYNQHIVEFNTTTTDTYIAFKYITNTTYNSIYIDDFIWEPTPTIVPDCAANVVATNVDESCGNFGMNLTWDAANNADAYKLTVGTTAGANDVMDMVDVGNVLEYIIETTFDSTYFYTVTPYNSFSDASGCTEGSFTTALDGCYCESVPTSNDALGITNVQLVATDFPNGDVTYFDHTATVVDFGRELTNNVQIVFNTGYDYDTNIWIDVNDDMTFDNDTELFVSGESTAATPNTLDVSFLLPAGVTLGQHRMRIGTADSGQATPNPCYSGAYGVTLDFMINVVEITCAPAEGTGTVVADCANTQFFVDVDVTTLGDVTQINDGTDVWPVTATGVVQVGPYTDASSVSLTFEHSDMTCDFGIGTYTYICPPTNDSCDAAMALTIGVDFAENMVTGTNVGATDSGVAAPDCSSYLGGDVWYSVIVPNDGIVTIDTGVTDPEEMTDSGMAIYSGACDSLTMIECDDDDSDTGAMAMIALTGQTPGDVLFIRIFEYGNNYAGRFTISAINPAVAKTNDLASVGFSFYPNPVTNTLTMKANENITSVSIFNMLGQEVITEKVSALETKIDMSRLTSGTYFVKAQVGQSIGTYKIIKK